MLGNNIRTLCSKNKITLMELAKESHVPYESLKLWGSEKLRRPNAYDAVKVANALGVTVEQLLGMEGDA